MGKKVVVLDLEMCIVPKTKRAERGLHNEIIQIGAVALDEGLNIAEQFSTYVKPEFGLTNSYIKKLTGITVEMLEDAPLFATAMEAFWQWLPKEEVRLVSWSMTDKLVLQKEITAKGLEQEKYDYLFQDWVDCQAIFTKIIKAEKVYSLSEALVAADIIWEGKFHDGLADAYNTALLYAKMEREGDALALNPYYRRACLGGDDEDEGLSYTLGDLFAGLNLEQITS